MTFVALPPSTDDQKKCTLLPAVNPSPVTVKNLPRNLNRLDLQQLHWSWRGGLIDWLEQERGDDRGRGSRSSKLGQRIGAEGDWPYEQCCESNC